MFDVNYYGTNFILSLEGGKIGEDLLVKNHPFLKNVKHYIGDQAVKGSY